MLKCKNVKLNWIYNGVLKEILPRPDLLFTIIHPRATQGWKLLNGVIVREYREGERGAYYENMWDRLALDLNWLI